MSAFEETLAVGVILAILSAGPTMAIKAPEAYLDHASEIRWWASIVATFVGGLLYGASLSPAAAAAIPLSWHSYLILLVGGLAYLAILDRIAKR